jgi:hypothetical protein
MVAPQQATLAVDEYLQLIHAPFIYPGAQFNCLPKQFWCLSVGHYFGI